VAPVVKVCLLEDRRERLRALVEGAPLPLVNALRRAAYTDVPVMAIDYVEVFENNTVLYDEIIAHRLGLIPLTSEEALEKYRRPEECENAELGDPNCYAVLRLEVETGAGEERMIYSGDLEPQDPDVRPIYTNMPIVLMAPEQRLRMQAYARLGYGREHAKWMPVSVAAHRYLPIVEFDVERMSEECMACIEAAYPWLAEKMKEMKRGRLELLEEMNSSALQWCARKKCGEGFRLSFDDTRFIVTIESTGSLPARRIVREALRAVARKAENLLAELEALRRS
jgi:DNA-directed RNA polymerase subunit D